ncbi:hypothetical protein [Agromyces kandeliae]|uniref:Uncharacterized protein n=1 Tax=Agromyces kandeliae TaxID=2666141 RepID=A0A6L5QZ67_9MICO|nr:hypothetical protein [Agromyces kandeliae]MRX42127.1 hypothetical protein [Agromyces kandeliae]
MDLAAVAIDTQLIGAFLGAMLTLAGVVTVELLRSRRERIARAEARAHREEDRERELWEISRPAADAVRERFIAIVRSASPPNPYEPPDPNRPDFEDWFPESWEDVDPLLERDIALIPSAQFRSHLTVVRECIGMAFALQQAGYERSQSEAVRRAGRTGLEVVSAWLRGERVLAEDLARELDVLRQHRKEVHERWADEDRLRVAYEPEQLVQAETERPSRERGPRATRESHDQ